MGRETIRHENIAKVRDNWDMLTPAAQHMIETTDDDFIFWMLANMTPDEINEFTEEM